jgi:hypothetical protein
MKPVRLSTAIAAVAATALVSTMIVTRTVHAQPAQSGPAAGAPMNHMMQMHGMMGPGTTSAATAATSDDPRQLAPLPAPMQEHMLASMRDHLQTLNTVIGDVADAKFDAASKLLEERLGMSSLPLHHAAEMAPYFPQPMQDAGTNMHHAASRLAIALQNASVTQTFDSMREVDAALHEVTSACVGCHAAYRLR